MQGRKDPGMTQYEAATQGPPSLKAIFAEMAGPTAYDFVFTNGTDKKDFVEQWGGLTRADGSLSSRPRPARVDSDPRTAPNAIGPWPVTPRTCGRTTSCRRRRTVYRDFDGAAANGSAVVVGGDQHHRQHRRSLSLHDVAIYHLVGWYDIYTTQQPFLYESLEGQVPQKMMIGPVGALRRLRRQGAQGRDPALVRPLAQGVLRTGSWTRSPSTTT